MRITGGTLTGRNLRTSGSPGLRPTKDMVRQSVFGMLAGALPGTRVLDLFAGSGAAGLEAWSRGAEHVTWVENDRETHRVLCANVAGLAGSGPGVRVVRDDAFRFLESPALAGPYHLVFADPPYEAATEGRWLEKTLRTLEARPVLTEKGVLVFEGKTNAETPPLDGWEVLRDKTYGSTRIFFLRRNPAPES
ncbi:MAG: 16S rRNA (guanine(966)-N(2))-methyltransferase RsmD [Kiritimatiellia bacterium]